ncbi:TetR family transcriptional regulator [Pyxidicoccus parkwayensis]|uniref:TetR family transcriptional regulator n=1 Tax=Pyxidicoccus parkwayensis TaxID=2813578 RepID=A0ABX7P0X3_9BACT|nr:TetR/AcrR family transcriptional regulator [Pyxidicoccus parkwaysis]QSQ24693.1 TetR family transcriptional regulator [Pyxidicoccus parkwaysis]
MGRWEPNARGRLEAAAMSLFQERGYDRTTVEEIAARAGLTERTFFRYFTDKREVLFWGSEHLRKLMLSAIEDAPEAAAPLDAIAAALDAAASMLQQRREHARERQELIAAHAELRERELIKLATLAASCAEALRGRGITEPAASLTAEAGIAVFKVAFTRWIEAPEAQELSRHIRVALEELRAITAGTDAAPAARARKASPKAKSPRP